MISTTEIRRIIEGNKSVIRVEETMSVSEAAEVMDSNNVGCVVVMRKGKKIVGILSERDVLTKVVAKRLDPGSTPVCDVMSKKLIHCSRHTPISKAQEIMAEHDIRHLPIVEGGAAVGMISSRDILAHQLSSVEDLVHTQAKMLERLERAFPGITDLAREKAGKIPV